MYYIILDHQPEWQLIIKIAKYNIYKAMNTYFKSLSLIVLKEYYQELIPIRKQGDPCICFIVVTKQLSSFI